MCQSNVACSIVTGPARTPPTKRQSPPTRRSLPEALEGVCPEGDRDDAELERRRKDEEVNDLVLGMGLITNAQHLAKEW
jgi:hypothetical protein